VIESMSLFGTFRTWWDVCCESVMGSTAEVARGSTEPARTSVMAGSGGGFTPMIFEIAPAGRARNSRAKGSEARPHAVPESRGIGPALLGLASVTSQREHPVRKPTCCERDEGCLEGDCHHSKSSNQRPYCDQHVSSPSQTLLSTLLTDVAYHRPPRAP
jgi:hypothetical protein